MQNTPKLYYTASEAQIRLGVSKSKFYKWVREGIVRRVVLPGMKQGVYPRRDVEAIMSLMSAQQSRVLFSPSSPADLVEEMEIAHRGLQHGTKFSLAERIALQQKSHFCFYSLKLHGVVIGSGSFFSLSARVLDDLLTGQKIEEDITPDMVLPFTRLEPFDTYLDAIAIDPALPRHLARYYGGVLIYRFIDLLFHWLANDYQVVGLYAIAHSERDEQLLRRLGFQQMQGKSLVVTRKAYRYLLDVPGVKHLQHLQETYRRHLQALL